MKEERSSKPGWNASSQTLVEILRRRAHESGPQVGFTFLNDGEFDESTLSLAQLDERARAIGAHLQSVMSPGDRALILYPPGLDYVAAFFGCLYAGGVAVPAYPPDPTRLNRTLPRLQAIAADAQANVVLTTSNLLAMAAFLFEQAPDLGRLDWIATDEIESRDADAWREPDISAEHLAFLQYTSGSTGQPKGVMLSHANLLHNEKILEACYEMDTSSKIMSWLPLYHDMGLIGGVILPVYAGFPSVLMSPLDFLKRPFRWMQAMSRFGATASGGPNFAFDLVVRKTTAEQRAGLDLSPWNVVCNGAEPVRADTMRRFVEHFTPAGLRSMAFAPAYGLAECTLIVSTVPVSDHPMELIVERQAFEENRVVAVEGAEECDPLEHLHLASSGVVLDDYEVEIVSPDTGEVLGEDEVGEIWLQGKSVARGYWNRHQINEETFCARLPGREGTYFRTADLGFLHKDNLFISGRLKDLIIIRGANHYPQDIEFTVENAHQALRPGCGAAFSVDIDNEEQLVVVHELDERLLGADGAGPDAVVAAIVEGIALQHDIAVGVVVLIAGRSIEKTSSGKIQRRATRQAYIDDTLDVVLRWVNPRIGARPTPAPGVEIAQAAANVEVAAKGSAPVRGGKRKSARMREIEAWLREKLAAELNVAAADIDLRATFSSFGLSSLEAVGLVGELETWTGTAIPTTALWDYPTISALAAHIAEPSHTAVTRPMSAVRGPRDLSQALAVVGVGCRFPGAANATAFWELLLSGKDAIVEVPEERWSIDDFYDPELSSFDKMNTRRGGFLDRVDRFDWAFFGLSKREAAAMDPQQRLVLEVAWEALEDAGVAPSSLAGTRTGVWLGLSSHDFNLLQKGPAIRAATGGAPSIAANRLSYLLDLRGPSMIVDTACSSSLVALDLAVQSLRSNRCDTALVGGVNVILSPDLTVSFSQAGLMAPDGRCKTFDAAADGYVRGEGCGMVVVKRLEDAIRDGDRVMALIRGTAVNQDGQSNGMTAPNGLSQQAVVRDALADAGVGADEISYVEAHGTGTELGDAIEVHSLNAVLNEARASDRPCWLGSVKTNVGHLEAAAGITGVIKTVLALHHEQIPAHLNVETLNPECRFEQTPFDVPSSTQSWPRYEGPAGPLPRYAGVSAFGFGGTNAHAILEAAPATNGREESGAPAAKERPAHVLTLSARSQGALETMAGNLSALLDQKPAQELADVAHSVNVGREKFSQRLALVADSASEASRALEAFAAGEKACATMKVAEFTGSEAPRVAFLFTGQGAQFPQMGRALYESQPTFREAVQRCAQHIDPLLERPLLSVMYPQDKDDLAIHQTAYTQPALFALGFALAELWRSWGVVPDAVLGHSVGEITAACVAGVFSLEDGAKLIAERGRLMQSLPAGGAMAAVFAPEDEVRAMVAPLAEHVSVAVINGPNNIVISGAEEHVSDLLDRFDEEGILSKRLTVSHAFHSPLMDPILEPFEAAAGQLKYKAPEIELVSNATGDFLNDGRLLDAAYWRAHVRDAVRFSDGVSALAEAGYEVFMEIGPSSTLLAQGKRCVKRGVGHWLPTLDAAKPDWEAILDTLAALFPLGVDVDWRGVDLLWPRKRLSLPTYPFERKHCWPKERDIKRY